MLTAEAPSIQASILLLEATLPTPSIHTLLMTPKRLYYINTVQNVAIYVCQKVSNIYADPDTIT